VMIHGGPTHVPQAGRRWVLPPHEGALLDDFSHFLEEADVMALLPDVHGTAIQWQMAPFVQSLLVYRLKTRFGIESIKALPTLLFADLIPSLKRRVKSIVDVIWTLPGSLWRDPYVHPPFLRHR